MNTKLCIAALLLCTIFGCIDGFSTLPNYVSQVSSLKDSSIRRHLSSDKDQGGGISEDDFMSSLRSRMDQYNERANTLPLVVLDSMLPRQVLELQVQNPIFLDLIRTVVSEEEPRFGMLGMARLSTGEYVHLKDGVEVQVLGTPEVVRFSDGKSDDGIKLKIQAGRRFRIKDNVANNPQGWTEARVEFLDSSEEELKEESEGEDRMSLARAISKARAFTNANTIHMEEKELVPLERWIELARKNERQIGQINRLLKDLGEIPPIEEPSELAFWIGALINPIPALGVAMEIRPALLTAKTAEERVDVALQGILRSIKHMDGTQPMFTK